MRILLVEDEIGMVNALKASLEKCHYSVDVAYDGEEGVDLAILDIYDFMILDIMLPKKDGFEVLKTVRQAGIKTPVILLTARTAVEDKVTGLDAGADDYLPKPFETVELLARIRALGRRPMDILQNEALNFRDIVYVRQDLMLKVGDLTYTLTKKEGQLLELLMKANGRIVEKETMLDKIWGFEEGAIDNNVEVYISFLRKKLKASGAKTKIKTVRGLGYQLV